MSLNKGKSCLSEFEIISKVGEGAFSVVYKVMRKSDGFIYALKKVKIAQLKNKEKENALNEIRILASIDHPAIVGYKEAFIDETDDTLCIVMEFLAGGDLYQKISECRKKRALIPEKLIWRYLAQLASGLRHLHAMKIVHRDLKSANVFLSEDLRQIKLGDLNVSKVVKNRLVYTQTGTPYYASPEVWRDEPYDVKSDIWSLGCVLYEMCNRCPPFNGRKMEELYQKVQKGIFERVATVYSEDLNQIVSSCLKVTPLLRPTCDEILDNPAVKAHTRDLEADFDPYMNKGLLNTIKLTPNLKDLNMVLPEPKYASDNKKRASSAKAQRPITEERENPLRQGQAAPLRDRLQEVNYSRERKAQLNTSDTGRNNSALLSPPLLIPPAPQPVQANLPQYPQPASSARRSVPTNPVPPDYSIQAPTNRNTCNPPKPEVEPMSKRIERMRQIISGDNSSNDINRKYTSKPAIEVNISQSKVHIDSNVSVNTNIPTSSQIPVSRPPVFNTRPPLMDIKPNPERTSSIDKPKPLRESLEQRIKQQPSLPNNSQLKDSQDRSRILNNTKDLSIPSSPKQRDLTIVIPSAEKKQATKLLLGSPGGNLRTKEEISPLVKNPTVLASQPYLSEQRIAAAAPVKTVQQFEEELAKRVEEEILKKHRKKLLYGSDQSAPHLSPHAPISSKELVPQQVLFHPPATNHPTLKKHPKVIGGPLGPKPLPSKKSAGRDDPISRVSLVRDSRELIDDRTRIRKDSTGRVNTSVERTNTSSHGILSIGVRASSGYSIPKRVSENANIHGLLTRNPVVEGLIPRNVQSSRPFTDKQQEELDRINKRLDLMNRHMHPERNHDRRMPH